MSRPVPWVPALALAGGDHPRGGLQAWCGALTVVTTGHPGEPPGLPVCPHCALIFLVESEGPRFGRPDGGPR